MLTICPSRSSRSPGIPCTMTSSTEMHVLFGYRGSQERGAAPAPRMQSSAIASSSRVVMPGEPVRPALRVSDTIRLASRSVAISLSSRSAITGYAAPAVLHSSSTFANTSSALAGPPEPYVNTLIPVISDNRFRRLMVDAQPFESSLPRRPNAARGIVAPQGIAFLAVARGAELQIENLPHLGQKRRAARRPTISSSAPQCRWPCRGRRRGRAKASSASRPAAPTGEIRPARSRPGNRPPVNGRPRWRTSAHRAPAGGVRYGCTCRQSPCRS